jgi:hypothetical protein
MATADLPCDQISESILQCLVGNKLRELVNLNPLDHVLSHQVQLYPSRSAATLISHLVLSHLVSDLLLLPLLVPRLLLFNFLLLDFSQPLYFLVLSLSRLHFNGSCVILICACQVHSDWSPTYSALISGKLLDGAELARTASAATARISAKLLAFLLL